MSADYIPEVSFEVNLVVDGEVIGTIDGYSYEDVSEQWHKLEYQFEEWQEEQEAKGIMAYEAQLEDESMKGEV